jgi:hypothetical protein
MDGFICVVLDLGIVDIVESSSTWVHCGCQPWAANTRIFIREECKCFTHLLVPHDRLQELHLQYNELTGRIPSSLGALHRLSRLEQFDWHVSVFIVWLILRRNVIPTFL